MNNRQRYGGTLIYLALLLAILYYLAGAHASELQPMLCVGNLETSKADCKPLTPDQFRRALAIREGQGDVAPVSEPAPAPPGPGEVIAASIGHKLLSAILALFAVGGALEVLDRLSSWTRSRLGAEVKIISDEPIAAGLYHGLRWLGCFVFVGMLFA